LVKEAKAGVRHIVKQSNILVTEMEAATNYARLHREAEKIIEESGIQFTFLRPNSIEEVPLEDEVWIYNTVVIV
jgi:uncharacterized protein YbjT (DUF2867 family)